MLAIVVPILAGVSGCQQVAYYEPSGPGSTVVGYGGAPSVQLIKIGGDAEIHIWVENDPRPARVRVYLELRKGTVHFESPEVRFVCQPSESVSVNIEKIEARANVELPWQADLVGMTMLAGGGFSGGEYWIEAPLPACAQEHFSVEIPKFSGTITGGLSKPIVFRLREGRFIPFHEWM